ncbi:hypothetical protein L195_g044937 [Trifolium pratense]|uniref:Uncharacterized protein n=1 Tax=Trifolium pratense TaxID=57577 RepID=A0A2K3MDF0_TRIPR|nr:hypothetical protein L195_g044937 [Trifolium pratense]
MVVYRPVFVNDTTKSITMRTAHMVQEWRAVNRVQQKQHNNASVEPQWQQPREGWWKCNIDASIFDTSRHIWAGAGV